MDKEFYVSGSTSEDLKRVVANGKALVQFLSHSIKEGGVCRGWGVGVSRQDDSTIPVDRGGNR